MPKKVIITILFTFVIGIGMGFAGKSLATGSYQSQINEANAKKKAYEQKKSALEQDIAALEKDKANVLVYVEKLDKRLEKANNEIAQLNTKVAKQNNSLAKTKKQLKKAQVTEKKQYVTMCRRIKYMYENTSSEYLDLIFAADSVSDFLNRAEYVEKISEYDRTILKKYKKTKQRIRNKKQKITKTIADLNSLKEEVELEKNAVARLAANKEAELRSYNSNISKSQTQVAAYQKQVAAQEQAVENLLAAERRRIEEQNKNSGSSDDYKTSNTKFRWPLKIAGTITSTFGKRSSPTAGASSYHQGIDIGVSSGTPIVAAAQGTVVTAAYSSGEGNYIMIHHGGSTYTIYMHCSRLAVSRGAKVSQGQVIGYVGSTGISTGPHLHFGISIGGSYRNPLNYVSR